MKQRIIGFDLARAYAIFGMYVVNFNIVFGDYYDRSLAGQLLSFFSGNSSTVFVMLAGMGIALMTNRINEYTAEDKSRLKSIVRKRAWFLFAAGLLLYVWWPADILHFYGGYMHIATLLLFIDKKYYLYTGFAAIAAFHFLLLIIPYETGWDFASLQYNNFWTIGGFLRNTIYNGWNSVFPWLSYFVIGMYLGRLDWTLPDTQRKMFVTGLIMYISVSILQLAVNRLPINDDIKFYVNADYLPPFLPFVLSTLGFGLMLISAFMYIGKFIGRNKFADNLAKTGQMTLTHYISHLTIGMLLLAFLVDKQYSGQINRQTPLNPAIIFSFASGYFILSFYFSKIWTKKFKNGPFETIMRKISG
ncbi:heparan-alpha-glucosaminide N-acetyltransferase domain-containing protein [Ignavibacteria bacterium]|nr:DUF418 domain-containing protein [Bacteroidota bacterium]MCZ2132919.1 DUF418 domain-containing protein [Bacteroidota bacterium]